MVGSGKEARDYFLALASGKARIPGLVYNSSSSSSEALVSSASSLDNSSADRPRYVQHQLLLQDIEAGATLLHHIDQRQDLWDAVTKRALEMLSLVIKPEHTPGFLLQVVSGRFGSF